MKFQSPEQMDEENKELEALEQAEADTSTNADAGPHFDPIIPLPDLVEVNLIKVFRTCNNYLLSCMLVCSRIANAYTA